MVLRDASASKKSETCNCAKKCRKKIKQKLILGWSCAYLLWVLLPQCPVGSRKSGFLDTSTTFSGPGHLALAPSAEKDSNHHQCPLHASPAPYEVLWSDRGVCAWRHPVLSLRRRSQRWRWSDPPSSAILCSEPELIRGNQRSSEVCFLLLFNFNIQYSKTMILNQ